MSAALIEAIVNGEPRSLAAETSIARLVEDLVGVEGLLGVAVARNGEVVPRSEWATTHAEAGDEIEIVRPIQGG